MYLSRMFSCTIENKIIISTFHFEILKQCTAVWGTPMCVKSVRMVRVCDLKVVTSRPSYLCDLVIVFEAHDYLML